MHGRLRVKTSKEQEEEQKIKDREKAYHLQHLTQMLFDARLALSSAESLGEVFKLTSEVLLINPDFYTAWNIRKEALELLITSNTDQSEEALRKELSFTIECLRKNEKSYSVWQHRIWTLSKMPTSEYKSEIILCNSFLEKDERNFHCWDYRSYICNLASVDLESEFAFTTQKIHSNFSNFSAWHRRHKILLKGLSLPQGLCPTSCDLRLIWEAEYSMVLNALFTDPSDQSPWLYHNWLVKNNLGNLKPDHVEKISTLAELEPTNKCVKNALDLSTKYLKSK